MKRIMILMVCVWSVTACSLFGGERGSFRDRSLEYKQARSIPRFNLPSDMAHFSLSDDYPISSKSKASSAPVDLYPPRVTMGSDASPSAPFSG